MGANASVAHRWLSRPATVDDRDPIAALHVDVWRATYRELAPTAAYQALDEARRAGHWHELLQRDPQESVTLVVEDQNGAIVAFGHAGPGQHDVMRGAGEVLHLYVHGRVAGLGIGRLLFAELVAFLRCAGADRVRLAVVEGNERAIAFYERAGGRCTGTFVDGVLWRSNNLIYEWELATPQDTADAEANLADPLEGVADRR